MASRASSIPSLRGGGLLKAGPGQNWGPPCPGEGVCKTIKRWMIGGVGSRPGGPTGGKGGQGIKNDHPKQRWWVGITRHVAGAGVQEGQHSAAM